MIWYVQNADEKKAVEQLKHDSDRAVAIVGAALVELRLTEAILARLRRDKKIEDTLFHPSGQLGAFGSKIDLAYLLGVLERDAYNDLVTLKNIRNSFAHHLNVGDFSSASARDRSMNLKMVETYIGNMKTDGSGEPVFKLRKETKPWAFTRYYALKLQNPRQRYLMTAALFSLYFTTFDGGPTPGAEKKFSFVVIIDEAPSP